MTKKELEAKIEKLEREIRNLQSQLNNHVCTMACPIPIKIVPTPHVPAPYTRPYRNPNIWYGTINVTEADVVDNRAMVYDN